MIDHLEAWEQRGKESAGWKDRPELYNDLQEVWEAFLQLHAARSIGFSANPIPPSEITSWLDLHAIFDPHVRLEYFELITAMDGVWLTETRKKNAAKANKK